MLKKLLVQIGVGLLLLVLGAAAGRYFAPTQVKTETKIEYQDRIVEKEVIRWKTEYVTVQAKAERTRIVSVEKPDGTKIVVTESQTEEATKTATQTNAEASRDVQAETRVAETVRKETTFLRPQNTLTLMGGTGFDLKLSYGAMYTRQFLGPVGIGVWYMKGSDHRAGVNLSLQF